MHWTRVYGYEYGDGYGDSEHLDGLGSFEDGAERESANYRDVSTFVCLFLPDLSIDGLAWM